MDDNKFFRFLWRVNAVLITCAFFLIIGKFIYEEFLRQPAPTDFGATNITTYRVNEKGETVVEERWRYGEPSEVIGTSSFVLPLYSVGSMNGPSYQIRNLVFVDADLKGRWLLPDNQSHILYYEFLQFGAQDKVLAILYEILDEEQTEGENATSIYLSRPDGKELTKVVVDLDRNIGHAMTDEHHLVIFYVKDGVAHSAKIALSDFAVVESVALPLNE